MTPQDGAGGRCSKQVARTFHGPSCVPRASAAGGKEPHAWAQAGDDRCPVGSFRGNYGFGRYSIN